MTSTDDDALHTTDPYAESERLRAAQERAYWLERWHIDLNALMRKPGAREFRAILRAVRAVARQGRKLKRRLRT